MHVSTYVCTIADKILPLKSYNYPELESQGNACTYLVTIVTGSAKTLHVRVFYASSQKQLLSPDSATDF